MKKWLLYAPLLIIAILIVFFCDSIGNKALSISIIYAITTTLSLVLLVACCYLFKQKDNWLLLLFVSVLIVNVGYLSLSLSHNVEEALLANRIAYLGSVMLPMAMMMSILNLTSLKYRKWISIFLFILALFVFFVAASPGYLTIYYESVSLEFINGAAVLHKVYGPWHSLYLFYLLGYFISMVAVICYATMNKKISSTHQAVILALAVFCNIGIWLLEQIVDINFEMLAVSYILSEAFLLCLYMLMNQFQQLKSKINEQQVSVPDETVPEVPDTEQTLDGLEKEPNKKLQQLLLNLDELTHTERSIFDFYVEGKSTQEVLELLNIKENTLKFHNKNIYTKLGVASRKELKTLYKQHLNNQ